MQKLHKEKKTMKNGFFYLLFNPCKNTHFKAKFKQIITSFSFITFMRWWSSWGIVVSLPFDNTNVLSLESTSLTTPSSWLPTSDSFWLVSFFWLVAPPTSFWDETLTSSFSARILITVSISPPPLWWLKKIYIFYHVTQAFFFQS